MPTMFANNWILMPPCGLRTDNPSTASVGHMTHVMSPRFLAPRNETASSLTSGPTGGQQIKAFAQGLAAGMAELPEGCLALPMALPGQ